MKHVLLALIFLYVTVGYSQTHNWTRSNPGGGGAFSTIGVSVDGTLVACSDLSGVYISQDQGVNWSPRGAAQGLTETHISGVGFHTTDANYIFVGTESGAFRSVNGGSSFQKVLGTGYITDITLGSTGVGYLGYHAAWNSLTCTIYKTTDNGSTWMSTGNNFPTNHHILKIETDPVNHNVVYVLTGKGRFTCGNADVFKSTDGGITWTNLTNALPSILDFAIDPFNNNRIFLTTMDASCSAQYYWTSVNGNFYISNNGGNTWGSAISGNTGIIWPSKTISNKIRLIDPREPWPWNAKSGTFTSLDGGVTFVKTGNVNQWDTFFNGDLFYCYSSSYNGITPTLGLDPVNDDHCYWVNYQWVFGTTDGGTIFNNLMTEQQSGGTWKSTGFDNVNMLDVEVNPTNTDLIYQAYFDIGLWKSTNHGQSWVSCNPEMYTGGWNGHGGNCAEVASDPIRSNVVWATMSGNQQGQSPTYLLKNINTGDALSWTLSNTGLPINLLMGLTIDELSPTSNRTLYITANEDVYKSIDDGATWSIIFNCNGCNFTAVDKTNSSIIFAGGEAGMYRSMDGGVTFSSISHPDFVPTVGQNFWDWNYSGIWDIQTDPNVANTVYVVVKGNNRGLYKSTDAGNTWSQILQDNHLRKVNVSHFNSNIIYCTSSSARDAGGYSSDSKGILFSRNGGTSWTQETNGMAYPFAIPIAIDYKASPSVFVGSPGTGFQSATIPESVLNIQRCEIELKSKGLGQILISGENNQDIEIEMKVEKSKNGIDDYILVKELSIQAFKIFEFQDTNTDGYDFYKFSFRKEGSSSWDYTCIKRAYLSNSKPLKIYPNPIVDECFVLEGEDIKGVSIFDLLGKPINFTVENSMHNVFKVCINDFMSGFYIVKARTYQNESFDFKVCKL